MPPTEKAHIRMSERVVDPELLKKYRSLVQPYIIRPFGCRHPGACVEKENP
jgi:hypothetical protein